MGVKKLSTAKSLILLVYCAGGRGGTLYILYAIAGKLLEIIVNHFGGHISMDSFGHLSMESLIGIPLWNRYRTLGGDPNIIIHPYFDFVNKKNKKMIDRIAIHVYNIYN